MLSHVFLDMDGVLSDFNHQISRLFNVKADVIDTWEVHLALGITKDEVYRKMDAAGELFWSQMPEYDWARDLYMTCCEFAPVTILTSPTMAAPCHSGKVRWLQRFFNKSFRNYIITPEKYLLAKPNVVLIDDHNKNIEAFRKAGGQVILFPQPWNDANEYMGDKVSLVRSMLESMK